MSRRTFIAINLPEGLKEKIHSALSQALPRQKFRVVERQSLHITLCFLGDVEEGRLAEIRNGMRALRGFGEFEIRLSGIGSFGSRVVWLGASEGKERAGELHARVCKAIDFRDEGFSCHVTLARNKGASEREVSEAVEGLNARNFGERFEARSAELMESVLLPSGPEHKVIESFPL